MAGFTAGAPCHLATPPWRTRQLLLRSLQQTPCGCLFTTPCGAACGPTPMTSVVPVPSLLAGPLPRAASRRLTFLPGPPRWAVHEVPCRMPAALGCCGSLRWAPGSPAVSRVSERRCIGTRRVSPSLTDALSNLTACRSCLQPPRLSTSLSSHPHRSGCARPARLGVRGSPGRSPPCGAPQVGKVVHIACGDARDPRLSSVLSPRVRGHLRGFLPRFRSPRPLAARRRGLRSLSSGIPCRAASPRGALSCVMASPAALLVPAEAGSNPLAGTAARCGRSSARRLLLRRAVCRSHASSRASPRVGPGRGRARVAGLPPPARHRPGRAMVGRRRLSGSVGRTEVRRRVPQRPGVPAC
jgi:hypothetical protein